MILPSINHTLAPSSHTQRAKALRLHLQRHVKVLRDRVHAEWKTGDGPQEKHCRGYPLSGFGFPVGPDLGCHLYTPEDCTDGTENVGGNGDGGLRRHCGSACWVNEMRCERMGLTGRCDAENAGWKEPARLLGVVAKVVMSFYGCSCIMKKCIQQSADKYNPRCWA